MALCPLAPKTTVVLLVALGVAWGAVCFSYLAASKDWDDERQDSITPRTFYTPPIPADRVSREAYVAQVEEILAGQVRAYADTLDEPLRKEFLKGTLLMQITDKGKVERSDLLGAYNHKHRFRPFKVQMGKNTYPPFPPKVPECMMEIKMKLDWENRRDRSAIRFYGSGRNSHLIQKYTPPVWIPE